MTEDDIMLMALDAGPLTQGPFKEWCKRFAALVAAHEREAIAKMADSSVNADKYPTLTMLAQAIRMRGD
jgi:hypothetical protein